MENQAEVNTFVAMMKEVARYAEKAGVVVALEDWISAEDNIKLLDAIGSEYVAVYYDVRNIKSRLKVDPYHRAEVAGQAHSPDSREERSDADARSGHPRLAAAGAGVLRHRIPGMVRARTGSPNKDIVADTRANIEYVRKTFKMPTA